MIHLSRTIFSTKAEISRIKITLLQFGELICCLGHYPLFYVIANKAPFRVLGMLVGPSKQFEVITLHIYIYDNFKQFIS